jgi:hypothetical protein
VAASRAADIGYIDIRAKWRVACLSVARWVAATTVIVAGTIAGLIYRTRLVLPIDLPQWMSLAVAQYVAVVALPIACVWAVGGIVTWVWRRWVGVEQDIVLSHGLPQGTPWLYLTAMAAIPWLLVIGSWMVLGAGVKPRTATDWDDVMLLLPASAIAFAAISVFLLVSLMPPPALPASADASQASRVGSSV